MNTKYRAIMTAFLLLIGAENCMADGSAAGHLSDFGYYHAPDNNRVLYVSIDLNKQFITKYSATPQAPRSYLNLDNQCLDSSMAMLDLKDPSTVDKDVILMMLTMAEALKKPIAIETLGCVNLEGTTYPRIRNVSLP